MPTEISHRTRIEHCLEGQKTDRLPYAFWRHFPVDDQDPYRLAASVSHFQNLYQFDLIKVTPASSYCLKDMGIQDDYRGNWEGTREYTNVIINHPDEWTKLPRLHPKQGFLGDFLTCMQLVTREFGAFTPVLPTIFSPLAQAKHLVGSQSLLHHLRKYPQKPIAPASLKKIPTGSSFGLTDNNRKHPCFFRHVETFGDCRYFLCHTARKFQSAFCR